VLNVEKTTDQVVNNEGAAKGISDPATEAGKEVIMGDRVEEVARATRVAPTLSPAAEVIDGDDKVASSAATMSFPMASIGLLTLIRQLEEMIQVCPSSSPQGSNCYVMASRDSLSCDILF
jgi:hypothetical protein